MRKAACTRKLTALFFVTCLVLFPVLAQETGSSIMHEVMVAQLSTSSALDIKLTLVEQNGTERERRLQTLTLSENGLTMTLTVFLSPSSVKNTRFLTLEKEEGSSDQWIFLPSLGKVKRIAAQEEGGSFMGSDFTYADMGSTTYDDNQATHFLKGEEVLGASECFVVESKPTVVSEYGKTITWVDKATYLPIKVVFYAKDSLTVVKNLDAENITKIGDKWITKTLTMTTKATNHSTRIEILQAKFDIPIDSRFFTIPFMETGRL
jgi:outer membrane lipoprotein-sorting protein